MVCFCYTVDGSACTMDLRVDEILCEGGERRRGEREREGRSRGKDDKCLQRRFSPGNPCACVKTRRLEYILNMLRISSVEIYAR